MAGQYGLALTSVAYATQRADAGIEPEPLVIGQRPPTDEGSDDEPQVWQPLPLPDALVELTRREGEPEALPRLVILDQLVRLAVSRGGEQLLRDDVTGRLEPLLRSLVPKEGVVEEEGTEGAIGALHTLARNEGIVDDPWGFFVNEAGASFAFTAAEVDKPQCNDSRLGAGGPTEVTVVFWTDRDVSSLAPYANPTHWPTCSAYFAGMVPQGPPAPIVPPAGTNYCGWEATFMERLALFPPYDFVTPLRFTSYWAPGWTYVRTAYRLVAPTPDILVDAGFIEIAKDPGAQGSTRVTATKVIRFTSPDLDNWPTLACDTFWTEMAIQMAEDCACTGGGVPAAPY